MGCGSSVSQVANSLKENQFKPLRLLELQQEHKFTCAEGRILLLGETKTQRRILEVGLMEGSVKPISTRTRIPVPKVHYDPLELMYEESQEVFHLGMFGFSMLPPFNRMLVLYLHKNVVFMCGGVDYDAYNIRNETFFYTLADEAPKEQQNDPNSPHPLNHKAESKSKSVRNKFQKLSSMGKGRYGHMGLYVTRMKSVLVFGGRDEAGEYLNSCERYGIMENSWREVAPMRIKRAHGNCLQFANKIYLFGGRSGQQKLSKKIEVYDLDSGQWEVLPFKIHRGVEHSMVFSPSANEILLVGGTVHSGPTASVIRINLSEETYVWDSDLTTPHRNPKGIAQGDMALIFGGTENRFEQYSEGRWASEPFEHRNYLTIAQMQPFSCSAQSTIVPSQPAKPKDDLQRPVSVILGNDNYPCLIELTQESVKASRVPMALKIKSKMGVCEYELNKYFITGGCDALGNKQSRSSYYFDSDKGCIRQTIKMNDKRYNFAICHLNGYIYVFGGLNFKDNEPLKNCARFSLAQQCWEALPTLRRGRDRPRAQAFSDNKIAVFGGYKSGELVRGIEVYSVAEKRFDIFQPHLKIPHIISSYVDTLEQKILIFTQETEDKVELMTIKMNELEVLESYRSVTDINQLEASRSSDSNLLGKGISQPLMKKNQLPALATKERTLSSRKNTREAVKTEEEAKQSATVPVQTNLIQIKKKEPEPEINVSDVPLQIEEAQEQAKKQQLAPPKKSLERESRANKGEKEVKEGDLVLKSDKSEQCQEIEGEEKVQIPMINNNILFEVNSSRVQEPPLAPREVQEDEPIPEDQGDEQKQQTAPMIVARSPPQSPEKVEKTEPIQTKPVEWLSAPRQAHRRYNQIYFIQPPHCIRFDTQTQKHSHIPLPDSQLINKVME